MAINLLPHIDERAAFLGMTGSGKTTCIVWVLRQLRGRIPIWILDSKIDNKLVLPGAEIVERRRDLPRAASRADVVVYRPADGEDDPKELDAFSQTAYETGDVLVVLDELTAICDGPRMRPGTNNLFARGRERDRPGGGPPIHTPVLWGSQSPFWIPRQAYRQTNRFYRFYLTDADDARAVARFTHPAMRDNPSVRHGFRYYHVGDEQAYQFGPVPR